MAATAYALRRITTLVTRSEMAEEALRQLSIVPFRIRPFGGRRRFCFVNSLGRGERYDVSDVGVPGTAVGESDVGDVDDRVVEIGEPVIEFEGVRDRYASSEASFVDDALRACRL